MEFDADSAKEYLQSKRYQPYISDWFRDEISRALESGNDATVVITAYKLRDLIVSHEAYEARTTSLAMRALEGFADRVLPKDCDAGRLAIEALVPDSKSAEQLNECEAAIIEVLTKTPNLKGWQLAGKAGYPNNSNFRGTLSSLVKRGLIKNVRNSGYQLCQD
jgi:hypothetical protein